MDKGPALPFEESAPFDAHQGVDPRHNVRTTDPVTSWAAAYEHEAYRQTLRSRCLAAIEAAGAYGCTDNELADLVGAQLNSVNKRRGELRDLGLVEDSGRERLTPAGSRAIVWVLVKP